MSIIKQTKDYLLKFLWDGSSVPSGLLELYKYFKNNGPIEFKYEETDNKIIAVSTNYRYGSIVTSGRNKEELERNIKDAILTSFDVPSSYEKEVGIHKVGEKQEAYAIA